MDYQYPLTECLLPTNKSLLEMQVDSITTTLLHYCLELDFKLSKLERNHSVSLSRAPSLYVRRPSGCKATCINLHRISVTLRTLVRERIGDVLTNLYLFWPWHQVSYTGFPVSFFPLAHNSQATLPPRIRCMATEYYLGFSGLKLNLQSLHEYESTESRECHGQCESSQSGLRL